MLFAALWITEATGNALADKLDAPVGISITVLVGLALIAGTVFLYLQPAWGRILEAAEDQGWFHGTAFKASQGVRVRRGTVVGVLTLGICGIYTLVTHRVFGFEQPPLILHNDWYWNVPFTEALADVPYKIPLMFKIHALMPVLLSIALLLFAWRLVNVPAFADFLIATEAEINKVSWTTRRRLIQDTIVVLVTVFLMTMFLFFVDIFWIWCLGNQYVGVLYYNPRDIQQKQQEKNQW
jgi:preprotein translocase SecE subunit